MVICSALISRGSSLRLQRPFKTKPRTTTILPNIHNRKYESFMPKRKFLQPPGYNGSYRKILDMNSCVRQRRAVDTTLQNGPFQGRTGEIQFYFTKIDFSPLLVTLFSIKMRSQSRNTTYAIIRAELKHVKKFQCPPCTKDTQFLQTWVERTKK